MVLPGTNINTSWLYSVDTIKANYGGEFSFPNSHERYRMLQAVTVYQKYYVEQSIPRSELVAFQQQLKLRERIAFGGVFRAAWMAARLASGTGPGRTLFRAAFRQEPHEKWLMSRMVQILDQFPRYRATYSDQKFPSIVDVYDRLTVPLRAH